MQAARNDRTLLPYLQQKESISSFFVVRAVSSELDYSEDKPS